jgi:hypothetical protein
MFPTYISLAFIGLTIFLIVCLFLGLNYARKKEELSTNVLWYTAIGLLLWFTLTGLLSHLEFFTKFDAIPPRFPILIVVPFAAMFFLLRNKTVKKLITHIPHHWPVYLQIFRIPMELILWAMFIEYIIPVQMTFEGANFDVLTAVVAIPVGFAIQKGILSKRGIIAYNIFGIVLVTTIVIIALLSAPLPFQQFFNHPHNTMIAYLPFVWLPAFVVPIAYFMHFVSLQQALQKE